MTVDGLADYGMERMDDGEIAAFLSSQHHGVLGVPADGAPAMRPMTYWFDGESSLYFVYVLGDESRKRALTERADEARFLVYRADTAFNWTSVLLAGGIRRVPDAERERVEGAMEVRWHPEVFERAGREEPTELYRFEIDARSGIKQRGLPPGFDGE